MQPYFFPYVGYYQLAASVNRFIFLDDVNYIKKGYINRNSILLNGEKFQYSIPVRKVSQNRTINNHFYTGNFSLFLQQIVSAYRKAPCFEEVYQIIEQICCDGELNVGTKNALSINRILEYLSISVPTTASSKLGLAAELHGERRIIAICSAVEATEYVNPVGGANLYSLRNFLNRGIKLTIKHPDIQPYRQTRSGFMSHLSIIDLLMSQGRNSALYIKPLPSRRETCL